MSSQPLAPDAEAARAYWTAQMELAYAFMETMRRYPIVENGEGMVALREVLDGLEVVYSTTALGDQLPRVFYVRRGLAASVRKIAETMLARGWILKIEDGYRSPAMQRALSHSSRIFDSILRRVRWELNGRDPDPAMMLRRFSALVATRCRVGTHISGSAIDIAALERATGVEIPRGGPYIEVSERTPLGSPFITEAERRNRAAITEIFQRHGWYAYPYEFWHYSSGDCYAEWLAQSGRSARYGPVVFDPATGRCEPVGESESDALLEPIEFYRAQIAAAQARLAPSLGHRAT